MFRNHKLEIYLTDEEYKALAAYAASRRIPSVPVAARILLLTRLKHLKFFFEAILEK